MELDPKDLQTQALQSLPPPSLPLSTDVPSPAPTPPPSSPDQAPATPPPPPSGVPSPAASAPPASSPEGQRHLAGVTQVMSSPSGLGEMLTAMGASLKGGDTVKAMREYEDDASQKQMTVGQLQGSMEALKQFFPALATVIPKMSIPQQLGLLHSMKMTMDQQKELADIGKTKQETVTSNTAATQNLAKANNFISETANRPQVLALDQSKAAETARHNLAEEGISKTKADESLNKVDDAYYNNAKQFLQGQKRTAATGPYQQAQAQLASAHVVEKWLDGFNIFNTGGKDAPGAIVPSNSAMIQFKGAIDQLISRGGGRSGEIQKLLLDSSGKADFGKLSQYITSQPQSTTTQGFLNQYKNELGAEKGAWTDKRNQYLDAQTADLHDYLAANPKKKDEYIRMLGKLAPDYSPFRDETPAGGSGDNKTSTGFSFK